LQVFAQENWEGQNSYVSNYRPDAGPGKAFDYTYKPKETEKGDALEEAQKHINATVAQLFYTTNKVHDLYYRYEPLSFSDPTKANLTRQGTASMRSLVTSSSTTSDVVVRGTTPSLPMRRTVRDTTTRTS
jgi:hypothetical protein